MQFALRLTLLSLLALMSPCSPLPLETRQERIVDTARTFDMKRRNIKAFPFELTSFYRAGKQGAPTRIYIEGDGLAYLSRFEISHDPTPTDPMALRLAGADPNRELNIAYLARPCQMTKSLQTISEDQACSPHLWTHARFSETVISAMNQAIDDIKAFNASEEIELIGFSGGAAVALLVAARRDDVALVRTVAGNLDHTVVNSFHNVDQLDKSLNPVDEAKSLRSIPQMHFVGGKDRIIPEEIYLSYFQSIGEPSCMEHHVVPAADHNSGWQERWPMLLKMRPHCLH